MATKKRATKKRATKKKSAPRKTNGLAKYRAALKRATIGSVKKIKDLERRLAAEKKVKARKTKIAQAKLKKAKR